MSQNNEQSLKEVIQVFLKTYKLESKITEIRLIDSWEKVMGKTIAKHTTNLYINKKKLFITLDSAVLREELAYAKEKIIKILNDENGAGTVEEIILR